VLSRTECRANYSLSILEEFVRMETLGRLVRCRTGVESRTGAKAYPFSAAAEHSVSARERGAAEEACIEAAKPHLGVVGADSALQQRHNAAEWIFTATVGS
jgi:hypothetical protein